jgi:hypothetical protein
MEKIHFSRSAERKLDACLSILSSFRVRGKDRDPKQEKFEELTWGQMRERSRLSEGALSKYVKILFKEGRLKGEAGLMNGRFVILWSLADSELGAGYEISEEDTSGELPLGFCKDPKKPRSIFVQLGVKRRALKTGKGSEKIKPRKTRMLERRLMEDCELKP